MLEIHRCVMIRWELITLVSKEFSIWTCTGISLSKQQM